MSAKITTIIPPRSYELIRDRVGLILATEIAEQLYLTADDFFALDVYIQRSKPIQPSETSLIIVSVGSGAYNNQTVEKADGEFPIFIDCFCTSAGTDDDRGDVLSAYKVQRLAGVVMAILEYPEYKTLDFAPPFIMGSHIGSFETGNLNREDSTNTSIVRITLNVRASQNEPAIIPNLIQSAGTQVTLDLTPYGYAWTFNN